MVGRTSRRTLLIAGAAASLGAGALARRAGAQAWPNKAMKFVVGFPAGGLTDAYARAYGEHISQKLGEGVVVENKPGAGSIIACETVAKAAPDGYTFLFTISTAFNQNTILYKKLPYNPDKDFVYVSGFPPGQLPMGVHKDVPAKSLTELVALAKKGRMTIGTYAPGSIPHMFAQQLNKLHGTQFEAVHYRGEAPMWQDLAAGQITAAVGSFSAITPHIQAGVVRPIGVNTMTRGPKLPDTPTFFEQGFKEPVFTIDGWIGMFAPAGTDKAIVARLSALIQEGAETPRIKQISENFGVPPKPWTAEEFEAHQKKVGPQWLALAKELGVTLD
jgi:tripartite-type tricarboxylate transporter receptor subunit TctC